MLVPLLDRKITWLERAQIAQRAGARQNRKPGRPWRNSLLDDDPWLKNRAGPTPSEPWDKILEGQFRAGALNESDPLLRETARRGSSALEALAAKS